MRGTLSGSILSLDLQLSSAPMIDISTQAISLLPYTASPTQDLLTFISYISVLLASSQRIFSWSVCQMNDMVDRKECTAVDGSAVSIRKNNPEPLEMLHTDRMPMSPFSSAPCLENQ